MLCFVECSKSLVEWGADRMYYETIIGKKTPHVHVYSVFVDILK